MKSIQEWRIFGTLLLSGLVVAILLPVTLAVTSGVSFTKNGYDVDGGVDPICWRLSWWPQKETVDVQNFKMMSRCYAGTTVKLTPLDLGRFESIPVMHTYHPYSFRVEASVDYNEIARWFFFELESFVGNIHVGPLISRNLLFRMALCDTSKIGFCNPLAIGFRRDNDEADEEEYEEFSKDRWYGNVSEGQVLQGSMIGNHIFSPWLNLTMREVSPNKFTLNTTIKMKLPEGVRGTFFTIGHGHFQAHMIPHNKTEEFVEALTYLYDQFKPRAPESETTAFSIETVSSNASTRADDPFNATEGAFMWLEAADSIPDNVVDVRPPPIKHGVSKGMKIGVGIASGFCSLCALATFVFILVNRNHVVMQLAQWQFMAWLLLSCLVTNVFVFTYMPTNDWHCRWSDFLQSIPLTMMGTILVGRSWRVYVTVSAASNIGLRRRSETNPTTSDKLKKISVGLLSFIAAFPYNICSKNKEAISQRESGFRKKVSAAETSRLILWLTLPQIILQALGVIIVNRKVKIDFNDMMSVGREVCDESGEWIRRVGVVLSAAAFATAVLLAWVSRDLPSAFNETDSVFQAATINTIVGLLAMSLDQVTSSAQTPPDVTVFLWSMTTLILSWTTVGFIVGPKVMRVRSGEKVVISNLLSQEKQSTTPSFHQTDNNGNFTPRPNSTRAPIHLRRSEAIPRKLEQNMLGVSKLLAGVRYELAAGRIPKLQEWQQLIGKVDELHDALDRIEFQWTEDDERQG